MNKEKEKKIKAGVYISIVVALLVTSLTVGVSLVEQKPLNEIVEPTTNVDGTEWHKIYSWTPELGPLGAEASQDHTSGFLGIYFVNHTAAPATAYNDNNSAHFENWSHTAGLDYANADSFNLELASGTNFDIVVRVVYVQGNGPWNGTGWRDTDVRINITFTGDVSISDVTGTFIETHNVTADTSYYGNVYWDNGYTLTVGGTATCSEISIEARY